MHRQKPHRPAPPSRRTLHWIGAALLAGLVTPAVAEVTIAFDFDGHLETSYADRGRVDVAAFTGRSSDRSDIMRRVREDFAPFDVLVTDALPDDLDQGYYRRPPVLTSAGAGRIRVVIGGHAADLGSYSPGLSTQPLDHNVVWAAEFDEHGSRRSNRQIAATASLHLARAFGMLAARQLHAHPNILLTGYDGSISPFGQPSHHLLPWQKTQIMSYPSGPGSRDIWWADPKVVKDYRPGTGTYDDSWTFWGWQDDVLSLTTVLGIRADDHADQPVLGTRMTPTRRPLGAHETELLGDGIIEINAVSWPGPCPPIRMTAARPAICPQRIYQQPASGGLHVDRATERDFFRFDVPTIGPATWSSPRLAIEVLPIDRSRTIIDRSNLDAQIEVWFRDSHVSPWTDITVSARPTREPADAIHAEWQATSDRLQTGEYAVAVKSEGRYGDLGAYTLRVHGTDGLEVTLPEHLPLDWNSKIDRESLDPFFRSLRELRGFDEAAALMARLAFEGADQVFDDRVFDEPSVAPRPATTRARDIEQVITIYRSAAAMTSTAWVMSAFVDWKELDGQAEAVWEEMQRLLSDLEPE